MELPAKLVTEILAALDQPRPHPESPDHRRMPRLEQQGSVLVTPWPERETNAANPFSVSIRNCSVYGIAILHTLPMVRGEMFVVRLMSEGRQMTAILCVVQHCRRVNPQSFVIGAEFARMLPAGLPKAIPA